MLKIEESTIKEQYICINGKLILECPECIEFPYATRILEVVSRALGKNALEEIDAILIEARRANE